MTNQFGFYSMVYMLPPCPGFDFEYNTSVIAELYYANFNPKAPRPWGTYYMQRQDYDWCFGSHELLMGSGNLIGLTTYLTVDAMLKTRPLDITGVHFTVDVAMAVGEGVIANFGTGLVPQAGETEYEAAPPPPAPAFDPETDFRVQDTPPNVRNQGLLKTISEADLRETDIYIFRDSNDQLVMSRKGLREAEVAHYETIGATEKGFFYKMLLRGPRVFDFLLGELTQWQSKTFINPELHGRDADHLRIGETLRFIAVNRATGYIGTAKTVLFTGVGGRIDFPIPPLVMLPPNLQVKAERMYRVESGLTEGLERKNIIGSEGSALTSDIVVAISTQWTDHDGSPLPADLPGYTGRLAKVTGSGSNALGAVEQFEIKPGSHLQMVKLEGDVLGTEHFYVHVAGKPEEDSPDFSVGDGAGEGALAMRPAKYTPIQVPVFVEDFTRVDAEIRAAVLAEEYEEGEPPPVLENIERFYFWPYRPEMHFSVLDFEVQEATVETIYDDEFGGSRTRLNLEYAIAEGDFDRLDPIGHERQLVLGLGYQEILALLGEDQAAEFPSLDALANLQPIKQAQIVADALDRLEPHDFLALQLYENTDSANALYEYAGLPLVLAGARPVRAKRTFILGSFEPGISNAGDAEVTDSFQLLPFLLTRPAEVEVLLLDEDQELLRTIIFRQELPPGEHMFLFTYDDIGSSVLPRAGVDFHIQLHAEIADDGIAPGAPLIHTVTYPGDLQSSFDGKILGQILQHDVLVQDGSLLLQRTDVSLQGRGPQLAFTRSYNNRGDATDSLLGQGWGHSLDITLAPMAYGEEPIDFNLPQWVPPLRNRFFKPEDVPDEDQALSLVAVSNGGLFKKKGGEWHPQRGHNGTLTETGSKFIYKSKDGTAFEFDRPFRPPIFVPEIDPVYVSLGDDGIYTRIGANPNLLVIEPGQAERQGLGPARPQPVRSIADRNNNRMSFSYEKYLDVDSEPRDRLVSVTDAVERSLSFAYEGELDKTRLMSVTGPDDIEVQFTYTDDEDRLLIESARDVFIEKYAYDPTGDKDDFNITKITDPLGRDREITYDADIQECGTFVKQLDATEVVKSVKYPDSNTAEFSYECSSGSTFANKRRVTDLRGNTSTYSLNFFGNPIELREPMGKTTKMTWSIDEGKPDNVMTSRTDALGRRTEFEYDDKGNITVERDALDNETVSTWNQEFSLLLTSQDRNGNTIVNTYDENGNLKTEKDAEDYTKEHNYNEQGDLTSTTDARGNTTIYTYDDIGMPESIEEPEGSILEFEHDIRGRRTLLVDPRGNETKYQYDNLDRLTAEIDAKGNATRFFYDAKGNKEAEVDRLGLRLDYDINIMDRIDSVTRSFGGGELSFDYDANGNLTSESDWKGQTTEHSYDDLNRRTTTINRAGDTMSIDYDLVDNKRFETDYENRTTEFVYDKLNRLEKVIDALEGTIEYSYDNEGNVLTEKDQENNTTQFGYDKRYLRTSQTNALNFTRRWEYDGNGNLVKEIDEEERVTETIYDKQNRKQQIIDAETNSTFFTYDPSSNLTLVENALGHTVETVYDELDRVKDEFDGEGFKTSYEYDAENN
ncbi:MAG: DUF6531 domain-containing protein, partial [Gammaproteobacteria bacterium]|nr:DUF6531 domain-containing protein [Gammaproteobacteria bacterium]